MIETHNPDIVCIVETWLSDDILDSEICFPGFHVYCFDRNRHGGGVALYIRNHVSAKVLPIQLSNVVNHELEILTVSLYHLSFKAGLSVFYRPPYIFDTLCNALEVIDVGQFSNFVLVGDFNVDMNNSLHPMFKRVCNSLDSYCPKLFLVILMSVHVVTPHSLTWP